MLYYIDSLIWNGVMTVAYTTMIDHFHVIRRSSIVNSRAY